MAPNLSDLLISISRRKNPVSQRLDFGDVCLVCDKSLSESMFFKQYHVCENCNFHYTMDARQRINWITDPDTFQESDKLVYSADPIGFKTRMTYKTKLSGDSERTGLTEAAVTGICEIGGVPAQIIVLDFGFMGGSMGCVVGEKVALALERSYKKKIACVAVITSGGNRFQEGVLSLMQMAKTVTVANQLKTKGIPFISILSNPSTGHTFASFPNLSDIILGEPGAMVGLQSLQVVRKESLGVLPNSANTSEFHLKHGMIDAIVERPKLKETISNILDLFSSEYKISRKVTRASKNTRKISINKLNNDVWDIVQIARHDSRPTSRVYIEKIITNFVELHGDRHYGDDSTIITGVGYLGGQTVAIVGQEKHKNSPNENLKNAKTTPEGFRKAQRIVELANKFSLPLITLVDSSGPKLGIDSEERGLANTIATTISKMVNLESPSISIIIGEGGSEAALPLLVTNKTLMLQNSILSVVSPEGAAEMIFQDSKKAKDVAESLKITAVDCYELGIIDKIVLEPSGGSHNNINDAARILLREIIKEISMIQSFSKRKLVSDRQKRFRNVGEYSSYFKQAIYKEVGYLKGLVKN